MKVFGYNLEQFEWDSHNEEKNRLKHNALPYECEEIFFSNIFIAEDALHSQTEHRFVALGRTDAGRYLFIAFTVRGINIRVISARDMNRKEKEVYDEKTNGNI